MGNKECNYYYNIGDNIKDKKRDLTIIDRKVIKGKSGRRLAYRYKCNKCGFNCGEHYRSGEFKKDCWIREHDLKFGYGCGCCCKSPRVVATNINSILVTAPWMIELGMSEEDAKRYTRSSSKDVEVICPNCRNKKKIKINTIFNEQTIHCKKCSDKVSYLSKYIRSLLIQSGLLFKQEVKYDWNKYINPLTNKESQAYIDFIIYKDGREIPLEADGAFHRSDNKMNGMTKEFHQNIDKQRDENCLKYLGEETIRISDEGDVKENILNSKLNNLYDLSNIDWNKCEEFALKNIVKEVCEYWNQKEDWETTQTIANNNEWGIKDRATIAKYLKKGTNLGWCYYNPEEELIKCGRICGKALAKPIQIFEGDYLVGTFNSARDILQRSEELLGVKLNKNRIHEACRNETLEYKGFKFKYI